MSPHEVIATIYEAGRLPLIFAHRGAQAYTPANTLPAFELARAQGADGVELDVHRSKDGHPVILHDFTITVPERGEVRVADLTLAELKRLDVGSGFSPAFARTPIPTLDEVFEAIGRDLWINVEIKSMTVETDGVEEVVAACITRHNMGQRVILSTFNPYCLWRFRALAPGVPIGLLQATDFPVSLYERVEEQMYQAYHPNERMVDEHLMETAHNAGHIVNVWTVNDPQRAVALRDLGVHGIITDAPDVILRAVGRR